MRPSTALISLLASTTMAQDIVSFYFPGGGEGVSPVATIKTANPTTTEMRIACPTGVDAIDCGWGPGVDIKIISSTLYQGTMSALQFTMSYNCDYNTKAIEMTCTADLMGEDTQTATFSGSEISFVPATVVEGGDILAAATATATPNSTAVSSSGSSASGSMKSTITTAASSSSAKATPAATTPAKSTSSASPPPASTGAAARFGTTHASALLALAGGGAAAAAVVGFW